jgi:hypothetical protein
MLSRNLVAGELLNISLRPVRCSDALAMIIRLGEEGGSKRDKTHMSPMATMQTVCQMPSPIRGATPRYRPLMPFVS